MENSYVPDILIFSLEGCKPCEELKAYLNTKRIEYREVRVIDDIDPEVFAKIYPNSEGYPHVILDGNEVFDLMLILESGL